MLKKRFSAKKWPATFSLVALLLLSGATTLHANTWTTFGYGPRAVAMGGAYTAVADDFSAGYYNPAGMLTTPKSKFGAGWQYVKNDLKANGLEVESSRDTNALYMGASMAIPFTDFLKDRIAFGYFFFQPLWYTVDVTIPATTAPQFPVVESQARMQLISIAAAVDFIPGVLLGGGFTIGNNLGASLNLGPGVGGYGGIKETISSVDQIVKAVLVPNAGALVKLGRYSEMLKPFTVGFAFRDAFYMEMKIPVIVVLSGFLLNLDLGSTFIYSPRQYVLGVAFQKPRYLISFDISYNQWSDFQAPSLSIATDINIPLIELKQGYTPPPNFNDTVTPRVGVEVLGYENDTINLYLRGGFFYEPSPVPEQTGMTNYLDSDRFVFNWGFGFLFKRLGKKIDLTDKPISFDVGISYHYLSDRTNVKGPDVRTDNPGYPEISSSGNMWYFAVGFSYGCKPGAQSEYMGQSW